MKGESENRKRVSIYLFVEGLAVLLLFWLLPVLAGAQGSSLHLRSLVSQPGTEPRPLHWEFRVLATGPPAKSRQSLILLGGLKQSTWAHDASVV